MREIGLVNAPGVFAIVDDEDFERCSKIVWRLQRAAGGLHYAQRTQHGQKKTLLLHRVVLDAKPGSMIDHVDGNGLDNRKANLRFCTHSQNQMNARRPLGVSGYRGVRARNPGFQSQIQVDGKKILGPLRRNVIEAAFDYDVLSRQYHGEFGLKNFPNSFERGRR